MGTACEIRRGSIYETVAYKIQEERSRDQIRKIVLYCIVLFCKNKIKAVC